MSSNISVHDVEEIKIEKRQVTGRECLDHWVFDISVVDKDGYETEIVFFSENELEID